MNQPMARTQPTARPYSAPLPAGAPGAAGEHSALSLAALVSRSRIETDHFYAGRPHDPSFAYELFRRALVGRCEAAWAELYGLYRPLVEGWVRRSGSLPLTGETGDYFVSAAFARFWRAVPAERLADFPTLASLLNYLQRCAGCVVIDFARAQSGAQLLPEDAIPAARHPSCAPDEQALSMIERQEFWRFVGELLHTPAERAVVHGSYVLGLKPGDIFALHPALFASVNEVYAIKRNVLNRLSRNADLRQMVTAEA
ncbi:MAG TPA: sigma-70 family RNA polymerase sigma factor [Roseiflexaceae bacterium]|nr:sigma-70 family RNA polymerase sigma factor [Roseiflexaceae bacterium]